MRQFLATLILILSSPFLGIATAERPVSLPVGQLVSYGGIMCGQVNGTWLPGVLNNSGKFITSSSSLSSLKSKLKKTKNKKAKAKLQKQIKNLQKQIVNQSTTCAQLGTGVIAPRSAQSAAAGASTIGWENNILTLNSTSVGSEYYFFCPAGGTTYSVWGTDTYTVDSSVCNAAVHAGLIVRQFGGNVRIRVKAGPERFIGSLRNGVESLFYGSIPLSFSFLNPTTGGEVGSAAPPIIDWSRNLALFRSATGTSFSFICPANGTVRSI